MAPYRGGYSSLKLGLLGRFQLGVNGVECFHRGGRRRGDSRARRFRHRAAHFCSVFPLCRVFSSRLLSPLLPLFAGDAC